MDRAVSIRVGAKLVLEFINCKYLDSAPGSFESLCELYCVICE